MQAIWNPTSLTSTLSVRLQFPWFGVFEEVLTVGTDSGSLTTRIEMDSAVMTATLCGSWSLTFTDLRWYVGGTLVYTMTLDPRMGAGPYTTFGINYKQAENQTRVEAYRELNPSPEHGGIQCGISPLGSNHNYVTAVVSSAGWAWDTAGTPTAEPITIDSLALPATVWPGSCLGSCTCSTSLPSVSETDSYNITVSAEEEYERVETDLGIDECPCPNEVLTALVHKYEYDKEYRVKGSWVDGISQDDPALRTSKRTRVAGCSCRYPLTDPERTIIETTVTDVITYAAHFRYVARSVANSQCGYGVRLCTALPGGGRPAPLCLYSTPELCYYDGYVQQIPVEPCTCTQADPSVTVTDEGTWVAAATCDGEVYTAWKDQTRAFGDPLVFVWRDAGFTGSEPCIAVWSHNGNDVWFLVYADGGNVHWRISKDRGESWSVATTIAAGASPRAHLTRGDGRLIAFWLDGTNIKGRLYDLALNNTIATFTATAADASSRFDLTSYSGGSGQWVGMLTYITGGNVTVKTSLDGVNWS